MDTMIWDNEEEKRHEDNSMCWHSVCVCLRFADRKQVTAMEAVAPKPLVACKAGASPPITEELHWGKAGDRKSVV